MRAGRAEGSSSSDRPTGAISIAPGAKGMADLSALGGISAAAAAYSFRTGLADQLRLTVRRRAPTAISVGAARDAIAAATATGRAVLDELRTLQTTVLYAANEGRLSGNPFSREARQNEVNQILLKIDRLVATSGSDGINLLSGGRSNVAFLTSAFGGTFEVTSKPLDSTSLNLTGISIVSDNDNAAAQARIQRAIEIATIRVNQFEALRQVFSIGTTHLDRLTRNSDAQSGTSVNLLA